MSISADGRLATLIVACFLLHACGEDVQEPARQEQPRREPLAIEMKSPAASEKAAQPAPDYDPHGDRVGDAAEILKRYYALIGERRYEEARRLREPGRNPPSAADFAANFDAFAEHRATVGQPSRIAEAGDWLYVEVPVQRYGKYKSGATFGNAGTMTLRRRKAAPGAEWRIYTSR